MLYSFAGTMVFRQIRLWNLLHCQEQHKKTQVKYFTCHDPVVGVTVPGRPGSDTLRACTPAPGPGESPGPERAWPGHSAAAASLTCECGLSDRTVTVASTVVNSVLCHCDRPAAGRPRPGRTVTARARKWAAAES
jgi:hypothetical protein